MTAPNTTHSAALADLAAPEPATQPLVEHRPVAAAIMRLIAVGFIAAMFAMVKLADQHGVNLVESLFYRFFISLFIIVPWLAIGPGLASVKTSRPLVHLSRTVVGMGAMALNFLTAMLLPLAEGATIGFAVPIFATILSVMFLSESVGRHRWTAIFVGFIGIIIVLRPGTGHIDPLGAFVALAAAFSTASVSILIRKLGATEAASTTVFWFTVLALPPLALAMLFFAQPHDAKTWGILAAIGVFGGAGQLALTQALRLAPISVVLPMDYSNLFWAGLFGWLIWSTLPGPGTWLGAPIIIASGLYIVWREHRVKSAPSPGYHKAAVPPE